MTKCWAQASKDSLFVNTNYYTITDDEHYIEVAWSAATSPGANNGELTLYVDGMQKESITNIDNDTIYIDRMQLGAVTEVDTGTRGTYYFDAFESRESGYIGPVAALPGNSVALVVPADSALASISYWLLDWLQEVWEAVVNFFKPDKALAGEFEVEAASLVSVMMLDESIPTGQVWKTYYYAGSQRVAMRVNDGEIDEVYYLSSDHLGSTSITTDSEGNSYGEMRYTAWGEVRYTSGQTPTDYTYTGQRSEVSNFGLMYYNARWYDSALGRFVQADSIIPEPGKPLGWDRFAYSYNNPVIYVDPDGHDPLDHEWYRVFRSTHNGRIPDIIDTKIRLFSLAYPEEYKQYDFYDVEGNYNIDVVRDVFSSPPETRSWGTMPSALSNLSKWYEPVETEEYVRDVGTLYSYLPIRHQQPDINLAVQEIVFRNPAVYINPEGLPNHLLDEDLSSNVHHFGWALNLGWSTSLDAAILINTLREFNSVNFNINQVNSADIFLGNRAVILAFDLKTFGIHPDRILVTTNTIILAD